MAFLSWGTSEWMKMMIMWNLTMTPHSRFSTSWHTLTWVPDTFFTALLSGRIPTVRDDSGAIFIDRDPNLFGLILNYLRTRDIDLNNVNIRALRHECDYFGITPLSRRLALCDEMNHSSCGDVLFYGYLPPPCKSLLVSYLLFNCYCFRFFLHPVLGSNKVY